MEAPPSEPRKKLAVPCRVCGRMTFLRSALGREEGSSVYVRWSHNPSASFAFQYVQMPVAQVDPLRVVRCDAVESTGQLYEVIIDRLTEQLSRTPVRSKVCGCASEAPERGLEHGRDPFVVRACGLLSNRGGSCHTRILHAFPYCFSSSSLRFA